jgi:hypothetical protein
MQRISATDRMLRVVRPDESRELDDRASADRDDPDGDAGGVGDLPREDYWARVQALRSDLDRLRPAN